MMTVVFRIAASLILSFTVSSYVVGQTTPRMLNILEGKGSFEDDADGDGFANWWNTVVDPVTNQPTYNKSVFTPVVTSESPAHGRRCQKITIRKNDGSSYGFFIFTSPRVAEGVLRPGSRLTFSFKYRTTETVRNVQWSIWYHAKDYSDPSKGHVQLQALRPLTPELLWREWVGEITFPEDRHELVVGLYFLATAGDADAVIWIDDVRLVDGRLVEPNIQKPIKLFYMYTLYQNWVESARRADAAGQHDYHNAEGIKSLNPSFLNIHWVRVAYTANEDQYSLENLLPFSWVMQNHPEWFLRDADGNLMQADGASSLDIGNPQLQAELLSRILAVAAREKWDALLLEFLHQERRLNTLNHGYPANYQTDEEWQAAVTSFLQAMQPLRQMGIKLIPNMGCKGILEEPGKTWIQLTDGFIFEWGFAMEPGDGSIFYSDWESWRYKFLSLVHAGSKFIAVNHRLSPNLVDVRRFALASYLCGMSTNAYFGASTPESRAFWCEDFVAPIGAPIGLYQVVAGNMTTGALIKRDFTNGVVLVNPTSNQNFVWACPSVYQDLDGNMVEPGLKTIAPRQGLILLNAPKLQLVVTASPPTPAPGETVVYRVEYRNTGSAAAVNAYISAPLPAYTSFVSATNSGVYDLVSNSVIWNVGTVAPGSGGVLTFRVRVN